MNNKKALIAMSGGVDSSVAAYLTLKAGYECMGTTMRLYRNNDIGLNSFHTCCSQKDIDDAAEVAFSLGIPYEVLDFTFDFKEKIIEKFIRTYESGGTPNPCIDCNKYMKFDKLLKFAEEKGMDYIVTGHYAKIEQQENGRFLLKKAEDLSKDQSYVLYNLTQEQLKHILLPLGNMSKSETRKIATENGFTNSDKPDSQDICFVPDGDYVKFMENYTGKKYLDGNYMSADNKVLGKHKGAVRYTIGQRKGLGIALGEPAFVYKKDMEQNEVFIGKEDLLFKKALIADELNWIALDKCEKPIKVKAKTRYRQREQSATVTPIDDNSVKIEFDEPQRAITVGQAVVMYNGDIVVGGGTIKEVL